MTNKANPPPIIIALDYPDRASALAFTRCVSPDDCRLKVGLELYTREGPDLVGELVDKGFDIFLDLKFHDIPTTVARACAAAASLGVWMINVHILGGEEMLRAARKAVDRQAHKPLLIGVSLLTSHHEQSLAALGIQEDIATVVSRLALLARDAELDGVVCSPQEAARLRQIHGRDFLLVTPGIRPEGSARQDQQRVMTPANALAEGSDYLVIGRPVTQASDPGAALRDIRESLGMPG